MIKAGDPPTTKPMRSYWPIAASGLFLLTALMPMLWLGGKYGARDRADLKRMTDVADQLHEHMAGADDASIFRSADASYQQSVEADGSNGFFDEARSQLGAPLETKFSRAEDLPTTDGGKKYLLRFHTRFAKGTAREVITIHFDSDSERFRMLSYSVESPLLAGGKLFTSQPASE